MSKAKSELNAENNETIQSIAPIATTAENIEQQIEVLSEQKSDEFIEALATETRRKISEKLVNGAFIRAVFGGESGVNFTALPSFGGSQFPEQKAITTL